MTPDNSLADHDLQSSAIEAGKTAHIIVFGNEKGGSGKSTSAMHTAIALLRLGYQVGTIDLDARQATFTRYLRNRFHYVSDTRKSLPAPLHMAIEKSSADTIAVQEKEDSAFLTMALDEMRTTCDFIVIDTPGSDTYLSRLAHSYADTLITPVNDSLIDLDLLADIDPSTYQIKAPSIYARMVAEQQDIKRERDGTGIRWIVMRNRLSHINANNKSVINNLMDNISREFGMVIAPGFGERVIFKELFLKGLTLMDLEDDPDNTLTMSQIAARQEVRALINV
ncbi:MAG: division plane positioning ATPase MipZ, partial [Alphaproteobacteria bacterium]